VPLPTNDDINKGIGKAASYGIGLLNKANTALDSGRAARIKAFADQDAAEPPQKKRRSRSIGASAAKMFRQ